MESNTKIHIKINKNIEFIENLVKPIFRNFKSLWLCSQLELERKQGQNVLHTVIHTIAIHVLNWSYMFVSMHVCISNLNDMKQCVSTLTSLQSAHAKYWFVLNYFLLFSM